MLTSFHLHPKRFNRRIIRYFLYVNFSIHTFLPVHRKNNILDEIKVSGKQCASVKKNIYFMLVLET